MSEAKSPPEPANRAPRSRARRPDLDTVYSINTDGSRNFLHPSDVKGKWQLRKNILWAILLAIYVGLPWIRMNGQPAVHVDIPGRNAFLFGQTFTNQDFYLFFFMVSGLGFGLFIATSLFGRLWCGYACPQTVFMEGVFRKVERWIEGPRDKRIRRNLGPWTAEKTRIKFVKWAAFLTLSTASAHAFMAYFIPGHELLSAVRGDPTEHWGAFLWVTIWTAILFFNYTWFREQTCLIICPYGRLQSALHDADTIVIGYDKVRGEPRSKKTSETGGDCIDCFKCVTACPTGIDIRNGLQMECIACANCIDACDDIMERIGKKPGLVRYDSERMLETGSRRSLVRPRVFLYAGLTLVGLAVATVVAIRRAPFEVRMLRSAGLPFQLDDESVRNVFTIRIQNKMAEKAVFFVTVDEPGAGAPAPEFTIPQPRIELESLADVKTPLVATLPRSEWTANFPLTIVVTDSATAHARAVAVTFRGP